MISGALLVVGAWIVGLTSLVAFVFISFSRHYSEYDMKRTLMRFSTDRFIGNRFPLQGKIAIVTGSTSGLGQQVAQDLYSMGATVIIASRNLGRCKETIQNIENSIANSCGKLEAWQLDTSDFDNVRAFVTKFVKKHVKLHFLINNAGIHYISCPGSPIFNLSLKQQSKQGYDLAFATNYMGHWLLTDLLLPLLTATGTKDVPARVVNVSSAYHLSVDGHMLAPSGADAPIAARADINTRLHRRRSYGNSKLAQILHTNELNRRLKRDGNIDVEVVSVCPGWVAGTNIAPENILGQMVQTFGFKISAGSLAPIGACVDPTLTGGEHVTNYIPFWTYFPFQLMSTLNVRDILSDILAAVLLLLQSHCYGYNVIRSSPESYNEVLARELYDWTAIAVKSTSE